MSVYQQGFDKGYDAAFKTALTLGKYKGLATALPKDLEHPPEILEILNVTRKGECCICIGEQKDGKSEDLDKKSLTEIIETQKEHSAQVVKTLHDYFQPLLKEHGLDIDPCNL